MAVLQTSTFQNDVTTSSRRQYQGQAQQGYYAYWRNNTAYNIDFTIRNIGGGGVWWYSACYNHHGNSYGAGSQGWYTLYSGANSATYDHHNYGTNTGGNIGWSAPGSTNTIRCTKNAGFYPGLGGCVIQLFGPI